MHDDPAKEAVEHLQQAALEIIKATRAFLDLAEELVSDPSPLLAVGQLVGDLAAKGRAAATGGVGGQTPPSAQGEPTVQHIRVS
ncbi:MAG: hypothetical protein QOI20_182 [Acidimicrobiaceae bacterium]|jgi:hypothetical protein|nr:hypothetical protein [Acidimicrobiaceae bacterium]